MLSEQHTYNSDLNFVTHACYYYGVIHLVKYPETNLETIQNFQNTCLSQGMTSVGNIKNVCFLMFKTCFLLKKTLPNKKQLRNCLYIFFYIVHLFKISCPSL